MATGVSLLLDCTISATFAAADAGGGETFANSTTFKVDKVGLKFNRSSADHSTGQDRVEFHRLTKEGWEATFETKLANATLLDRLYDNDLMKFTVSAATGIGFSNAEGLITGIEPEYAGPSTLKFSVKCRGSVPTIA